MLDKIKFDGLADDVIAAIKTPEPDFYMSMTSSLNIDKGIGTNVFTRSSTATYIDEYGELKTAEIDEPRLQKDGYLMELQGTNLITVSETMGMQTRRNLNVVTNTVNGFAEHDCTINSTGITTILYGDYLPRTSVNVAFSFFVNFGTRDVVRSEFNRTALGERATVSFKSDGTFAPSTAKATMHPLSGGWFKCTHSVLLDGDSIKIPNVHIYCDSAVAGQNFKLKGIQLEEASDASSYIPTSGAAVTRAADILDLSKFAWVKKDYTMSYELSVGKMPTVGYADVISTQGISFNLHRVSTNGLSYYVDSGGLLVDTTSNSSNKVVTTYDSNKTQSIAVNGVQSSRSNVNLTNDTSITGMQIRLHTKAGYNGSPYIHIKNLKIWREALTDEQARGIN